MSENPYATGSAESYAEDPLPKKAPTGLVIVSVLMIILGTLGMLGICLVFAQPLLNSFLEEGIQQMSEQQAKMQRLSMEHNKNNFVWNVAFAVVNCLIAPALIVGGIGCLARKPWGWRILTMATLGASVFVLVRGVAAIFLQMPLLNALKELTAGDAELEQLMRISIYVGLAIGIVYLVCFSVFYLWSHFYLKRPYVRGYLGVDDTNPYQRPIQDFPR